MKEPMPLFDPRTVKKLCQDVVLTKEQEGAAEKWLELLESRELKEDENTVLFAVYVLHQILGHPIDDLLKEKKRTDFMFKNSDGINVVCFETKGTDTKDLFKKVSGRIKEHETPIKQTWTYMGENGLKYGVCTNYNRFVLITDEHKLQKCHIFDFDSIKDDSEKLKEFVGIFSKERMVDDGAVKKIHEKSINEEKEFTKEFYKLFHETRLMLIKEFQNNGMEKLYSIHMTQIFLNRLMFMFFVEDMDFISNKRLFHKRILELLDSDGITEHTMKIYNEIKDLFLAFDKGSAMLGVFGFNGGLFKDELPKNMHFNDLHEKEFFADVMQNSEIKKSAPIDEPTQKIISKYPNLNPIISNMLTMESYNFKTEVNVNILGHIFEQSISDIEELQENKDSKRKKDGVYYTPEYITDYICRNTIIPYLSKSNKPVEIDELVEEYAGDIGLLEQKFRDMKILDPACGSGAFLIKAVDVLLEIHREIQDYKQAVGKYTVGDQFSLEKWSEEAEVRKIIDTNIFGVDKNQQSVEITKLAMFLKTASQTQKLPNLSKNIMSGNSLIRDRAVDPDAFDWEIQFPQIFSSDKPTDERGFDIIIGNPPYVRHELLENKNAMNLPENNSPGWNGPIPSKTDLSGYFYYQFLDRLKDNGKLGFINSDSWMSFSYGKELQETILKTTNIKILMRTELNVFEDADTKTITSILEKTKDPKGIAQLIHVKKRDHIFDPKNIIEKPQNEFEAGNWNLYFSKNEFKPRIKMVQISDMGNVTYGEKTGCNSFFVLTKKDVEKYGIKEEYRKPVVSKNIHEGVLEDNDAVEYLLDVNDQKGRLVKSDDGRKVLKYIEEGEMTEINPKGKNNSTRTIPELASVRTNNPWYSLKLKTPPSIFMGIFADRRMKMHENNGTFYAKNNFTCFQPDDDGHVHAFLAYFSSSWFSLYMEKHGHPAGGGALQFLKGDYQRCVVPDFTELAKNDMNKMKNAWLAYRDDFDRTKLDKIVLDVLGFKPDEQELISEELESHIKKRTENKKSDQG